MKNLTHISWLIILSCFLCLSCKQITKSVDETFHPNDSLAKKYNKENRIGSEGEYTGTTKTTTTTSTQHHQEKFVVINGDTVKTPELQDKAKELFHDLELLKQKQTPAGSKEIQKRVNEFLKDMNLPQPEAKNSNTEKPVTKARKGMLSASQLAQAEEKLRQLPQYRDREIVVYESVHFYEDGSIKLALQHPENPKYVDAYQYKDGYWSEPKPVQARNIERRTFPLSKINFAAAQKVMQIYNDKAAQVDGAKPTTTAYISIWDNGMRWFPSTINGSRERYDLQFNGDGTLKSFRQE
ncbi:hypothetical protein SRABI27_00980 [Pedobacter sp. Bi27]|uniref:hypothetical protein n=1 Tax=unclassified Pedobacter TaxID=2628915 RepID=UPI001D201EF1|nr:MULTISPECIES: hypothetical protein [unclassified Pedobacter]CAH0169058.1 hypothetical protein SRABI126_00982 [Pedobacter sp. Bi126]CAH0169477.1 hypothetical protein SRABI27_00980 [Pedobacter sp. Bi27]CAH0287174.1 hypothetical protein SRABI36_04193 [Pedobacter sp. Bi36]